MSDRHELELRRLTPEAIDDAHEKARHYRLLNEPAQAESICLDILAVDPGHQGALATMLLALTDQFPYRLAAAFREAMEVVPKLESEYARSYYEGIVWERHAKARHKRGGPGTGYAAYELLRQAMDHYEAAEKLRPAGNDEAILRWNTCVRILDRDPQLKPAPRETFQPLLE